MPHIRSSPSAPGPDPDYSAQRHRAVGAVASAERSRRLAGQFRAPRNACTLNATNDYEAVQAWLALHETVATQRAYRKEAARLILWAIVERGRALSSLTTDDAIAYRAFVRHPTPRERWVGPPRPRDSVEWRPFSGGLSARSAAYALTVLSALFRWLIEQRYVLANPFAGVKVRGHALRPALDTARGFTEENGYCCAPLQTAWNGPTAGPSRQHNACASCSTSAMPRACALANWSAPSWVMSASTSTVTTGCIWLAKVANQVRWPCRRSRIRRWTNTWHSVNCQSAGNGGIRKRPGGQSWGRR